MVLSVTYGVGFSFQSGRQFQCYRTSIYFQSPGGRRVSQNYCLLFDRNVCTALIVWHVQPWFYETCLQRVRERENNNMSFIHAHIRSQNIHLSMHWEYTWYVSDIRGILAIFEHKVHNAANENIATKCFQQECAQIISFVRYFEWQIENSITNYYYCSSFQMNITSLYPIFSIRTRF